MNDVSTSKAMMMAAASTKTLAMALLSGTEPDKKLKTMLVMMEPFLPDGKDTLTRDVWRYFFFQTDTCTSVHSECSSMPITDTVSTDIVSTFDPQNSI